MPVERGWIGIGIRLHTPFHQVMTQRSFANICALHMHHACPFGLLGLGRYNKDSFIRLVARPGLIIYSRGGCFLPFSSGNGQHTHPQTTANNALTSVITVQGGAAESLFYTTMSTLVFVHFLGLFQELQMVMEQMSCVNINIRYLVGFSHNEHGVGLLRLGVQRYCYQIFCCTEMAQ